MKRNNKKGQSRIPIQENPYRNYKNVVKNFRGDSTADFDNEMDSGTLNEYSFVGKNGQIDIPAPPAAHKKFSLSEQIEKYKGLAVIIVAVFGLVGLLGVVFKTQYNYENILEKMKDLKEYIVSSKQELIERDKEILQKIDNIKRK